MRNLVSAMVLFTAALVAWPGTARAQSCVGFTDVPAASPFCPNVEWLKNRAVTFGCTSTTLYCPGDVVSRLAMAAFMNRLGKALSPEVLFRETGIGVIAIPSAEPYAVRCDTADSSIAAYPRTAIVTGALSGLADANPVAWRGVVVFSTDAGATWQAPGASASSLALRASSVANQWSGTDPNAAIDLQPGLAYRFGIGMLRDDLIAGTTGNFADYRCLLTASVVNRNGTSSPFDLARAGLPALH